jgi:hypothetical protein
MHDDRRPQKEALSFGDVIEQPRRAGISESLLSEYPKRQVERGLSLDAVIDDMRAILWPDSCAEGVRDSEKATTTPARWPTYKRIGGRR